MRYLLLLILLKVFPLLSHSQESIQIERVYTPNTVIYVNEVGNSFLFVSTVFAKNHLEIKHLLKEGEYIDDIIPNFSYVNKSNLYKYNIVTEYFKPNFANEYLGEIKHVEILPYHQKIDYKNFSRIKLRDDIEYFDQCNKGVSEVIESFLVESIGDYGVLYRKYSNKEKLEIILFDCSIISTIDINPKKLVFKKLNEQSLILYNEEYVTILSTKVLKK